MLFGGSLFLLVGIVAAVQLHWVALIIIPFAALILWAWWLSHRDTRPVKTISTVREGICGAGITWE